MWLIILGVGLMLIGLILCNSLLFNYIIVLENFNILILLFALSLNSGCRMVFICVMSLFVIEVSLMLIVVGNNIKSGCIRVPFGL
uniref:NADH dehydrogenase subunit 4L n=1 Tax=Schistosoma spindalis TaxID=6189 RepID=Q1I0M9_SCHSI|nr:NADH dehydrogenase subunit 4L [Schistosoma spindale]AAZ57322.1 NADH dehydrogenase subunit 4L [Schistosoma spindale]